MAPGRRFRLLVALVVIVLVALAVLTIVILTAVGAFTSSTSAGAGRSSRPGHSSAVTGEPTGGNGKQLGRVAPAPAYASRA
jgi:hypothetical protein